MREGVLCRETRGEGEDECLGKESDATQKVDALVMGEYKSPSYTGPRSEGEKKEKRKRKGRRAWVRRGACDSI